MNLLDVVTPLPATGLFTYAWLLIAIPALSAAILLIGGRATDAWGHLLGTLTPLISFALGFVLFVQLVGRDVASRAVSVPLRLDLQRSVARRRRTARRPVVDRIRVADHWGRRPHPHLLDRLHGARQAAAPVLCLPQPLRGGHAAAGPGRQLPRRVRRLGRRGPGLVPAHRLLAAQADCRDRRQEGFRRQPGRRHGNVPGDHADAGHVWILRLCRQRRCRAHGHDDRDRLGLLLLLGACGKSAQVPLQSWLLDAMEGPTPVSALIHAATMVTAGVYLVTRSHAIFVESEAASTAVVIVGAVTLLAGAWIGCAKDDIKVLAGSTMSQIGYMMLAAGLGPTGYALAIFHLLTHGFFKANMFLGAGSVMHAMDDDVNMRHYGGLAERSSPSHLGRLPGDHRLPVLLRLLLQGPHHRGGVRAQPGQRIGGAHRRRDHRVLHDPADDDDLRRYSAGLRRPSA